MAPRQPILYQFSDRLYWASFSDPVPTAEALNCIAADPSHRPRIRTLSRCDEPTSSDDQLSYYYFTIDDQLVYLSFFHDWGPLNLAMVYKTCIYIHELLGDVELASHRIVMFCSQDSRRKANSALLLALYVMIVLRRAPWEAFHPIAEIEFMPFRDAGRGPSDFNLNIQDCLWGVWKAIQNGLCNMNDFDVDDYEYYEKVENGDWNWITPNFIAFASPVDSNWINRARESMGGEAVTPTTPLSSSTSGNLALQRKLPTPFLNCLEYFEKRNIKLVVRLNNPLYDREVFIERGIDHMELYFDDGTNPTDEIVRTFLDVSDRIIEDGGVVAIHCKAGLGRTGTLIGAYLIWKYGFTASEAIGFMRIVRPGSVVGPQQQYMYLKQLEWSKWAAIDEIKRSQAIIAGSALRMPTTPTREMGEDEDMNTITPPRKTVILPPVTPSRHVAAAAAKAKAIATPGQPRKTPVAKRVASHSDDEEGDVAPLPKLNLQPIAGRTRAGTVRAAGRSQSIERHRPVTRSSVRKPVNTPAATPASTPVIPVAAPASPAKRSYAHPNKIPRLATTRTAGAAKAVVAGKKYQPPPSPVPSRLPRLKTNPTLTEVANSVTLKKAGASSDAWMKENASAVVERGSNGIQSGRPGLRTVRRRRSSFSSVDVVA